MADRDQWEKMGMLGEVLGLAPALLLVVFAAMTALCAMRNAHPWPRAGVVVVVLALGTLLLSPGLLVRAASTGVWPMFGSIALMVTVDFALTFSRCAGSIFLHRRLPKRSMPVPGTDIDPWHMVTAGSSG